MSETCICNQFVNIPRLSLFQANPLSCALRRQPARKHVQQHDVDSHYSLYATIRTRYSLGSEAALRSLLVDPIPTRVPIDEMVRETLRQGQQAAELARSSLTRLIPAAQSARYLQYQSAASAQPSHP